MYEYECLGCGKKYYSAVKFSDMYEKDRICGECGDYIFYSPEELILHKDNEKWLKKEYSVLEKLLNRK